MIRKINYTQFTCYVNYNYFSKLHSKNDLPARKYKDNIYIIWYNLYLFNRCNDLPNSIYNYYELQYKKYDDYYRYNGYGYTDMRYCHHNNYMFVHGICFENLMKDLDA